jgi:uncharacterized protein (TIGR03083 family)
MMPRTRHDAMRWTAEGTTQFRSAIARVSRADLDASSLLPGWTRGHVVAHVAANAAALSNLIHWARTNEPTPMYASPKQRTVDIERGRSMSPDDIRIWVQESADMLEAALSELTRSCLG